jgi:hypothetical protein
MTFPHFGTKKISFSIFLQTFFATPEFRDAVKMNRRVNFMKPFRSKFTDKIQFCQIQVCNYEFSIILKSKIIIHNNQINLYPVFLGGTLSQI